MSSRPGSWPSSSSSSLSSPCSRAGLGDRSGRAPGGSGSEAPRAAGRAAPRRSGTASEIRTQSAPSKASMLKTSWSIEVESSTTTDHLGLRVEVGAGHVGELLRAPRPDSLASLASMPLDLIDLGSQVPELALDLAPRRPSGSLPCRWRRSLRATTSWRTLLAEGAIVAQARPSEHPRRAASSTSASTSSASRPFVTPAVRAGLDHLADLLLAHLGGDGVDRAVRALREVLLEGRSRPCRSSAARCRRPARRRGPERQATSTMMMKTLPSWSDASRGMPTP